MDAQNFLRLLQIFDSQFPVGAFAHSGGLETYAQIPFDRPALAELLVNQIESGWGRLDLAAAYLAWKQPGDIASLERLCAQVDAWKIIPASRETSLRLGRRTLALLERLYPALTGSLRLERPHQSVLIGAFGGRLGLPARELLLAFGHSTLMASLAAATRCMPLSPGEAQSILSELQPCLARQAETVMSNGEDSLYACTPALDIRSHQQTFLYTRLFLS